MKQTVEALRQRAKRKKLRGYSQMNKSQLLDALGIKARKPVVQHRDPVVRTRESPAVNRGDMARFYWPEDREMPRTYRRSRVPCPKCRRLLRDDHSQAVVCTSLAGNLAYFRCRACEHRWKLPVQKE